MAKEKNIGLNLTEGNILRMLLLFVLPIFMTNLVQQFYNIVDVMIVGLYVGKTGTVGVSTGGEIVNLFTFVSVGFPTAPKSTFPSSMGRTIIKRSVRPSEPV